MLEFWSVQYSLNTQFSVIQLTDFMYQELVELGMMMREAAKYRGINIPISGSLASVLVQYAELLASQGYLEAAEMYLGESQDVCKFLY